MGTALIAFAAPDATTDRAQVSNRPRADFLAQLIAARTHAPQTRARRRAAPAEAIAAYDAHERVPVACAGRTLSRSL
jgi:hypothetical protein